MTDLTELVTRLREALGEIGRQKLSTEMSMVDRHCADFEAGYDACVSLARATLREIGGAA